MLLPILLKLCKIMTCKSRRTHFPGNIDDRSKCGVSGYWWDWCLQCEDARLLGVYSVKSYFIETILKVDYSYATTTKHWIDQDASTIMRWTEINHMIFISRKVFNYASTICAIIKHDQEIPSNFGYDPTYQNL